MNEREAAGLLPEKLRQSEEATRERQRKALREFLVGAGYVCQNSTYDRIRDAMLVYLADSPARLVLLNMEDLWDETRSQNVPSSMGEQANWQRKARLALEDFKSDATVLNALHKFAAGFDRRYPHSEP